MGNSAELCRRGDQREAPQRFVRCWTGAADAEELEQLGVTVIDLSEIDDLSSGSHSKFAGSPAVVQLIGAGLNSAGGFGESGTPGLGQLLSGVPIRIIGNWVYLKTKIHYGIAFANTRQIHSRWEVH